MPKKKVPPTKAGARRRSKASRPRSAATPGSRRPAASKRTARGAGSTSAKSGRFTCPECGFEAAHAMGLGRHRSARHGVVSKRQMNQHSRGSWLTREEASKRAGVHYNTIRQWERSGLVKSRRDGRTVLIDARTLARASGSPAGADAGAVLEQLERFYAEMSAGLKRLLDAADKSRSAVQKSRKRS